MNRYPIFKGYYYIVDENNLGNPRLLRRKYKSKKYLKEVFKIYKFNPDYYSIIKGSVAIKIGLKFVLDHCPSPFTNTYNKRNLIKRRNLLQNIRRKELRKHGK